MTWSVVSPALMVDSKSAIAIQEVDVPLFVDETDYEEILGRAFSSPTDRDRLTSGLIVVLATKEGFQQLKQLNETTLAVPVQEAVVSLALKRQIVALQWYLE